MDNIITDAERCGIIKALAVAYQKTTEMVEITPSLKRNKKNCLGYIRNWMVETELSSCFQNTRNPTIQDNCEYTVFWLNGGCAFTVEHVAWSGSGPRKAKYKDVLSESLNYNLFSDEEIYNLQNYRSSTYGQLLYSGTEKLESVVLRSANGAFNPINLSIENVDSTSKRVILEDSTQFVLEDSIAEQIL